jgi:Tol biopolymer transport system component
MRMNRLLTLTLLVCTLTLLSDALHLSEPRTARAQRSSVSDDLYPAWSPDGRRIAFVSTRAGSDDLYVMDANGTNIRQLTNAPEWDSNLDWSPDGRRLVFASTRTGDGDIYTVSSFGGDLRRLTDAPGYESDPSWSPDGTRILFSRRVDRPTDNFVSDSVLMVMNADGSDPRNLSALFWNTADQHASTDGVWSPDGSQIAVVHYIQYRDATASCGNDGNIYLLDAADSAIRRVIHIGGGGYLSRLNWTTPDVLWVNKSIDPICPTALPSGWYALDLAQQTPTPHAIDGAFGGIRLTADGARIAYQTSTSGGMQTVIVDTVNNETEFAVESDFISNPFGVSWSPDGRYLATSVCTERDADIFVYDTETNTRRNLTLRARVTGDDIQTQCGMLG